MSKPIPKRRLPKITRHELRKLEASARKFRKKLQAHFDAIEESKRITGDDLKIIVRVSR